MDKTKFFTVLFVCAGAVALIVYSKDIAKSFVNLVDPPEQEFTQPELAKLLSFAGSVSKRSPNKPQFTSVNNSVVLRHSDTLKTDLNSEAIIELNSGYKLRFFENSIVSFEFLDPNDNNSKIYLAIQSGDFEVLEKGTANTTLIVKDQSEFEPDNKPKKQRPFVRRDQIAPDSSKKSSKTKGGQRPSKTQSRTQKVPDKIQVSGRETLSSQYIQRILARQASSFRRCQLNSLRDRLNAVGSLLLSIKINPSGRVNRVQVLQNQTDNTQMTNCVVSVVKRVRFQDYRGDPITTTYPIEFE